MEEILKRRFAKSPKLVEAGSNALNRLMLKLAGGVYTSDQDEPKAEESALDETSPVLDAKVVRIVEETSDTKSYFFTVENGLKAYSAGSHLNIAFETDQGTVSRTYTLSSSPKQAELHSITVKRVPDGRASNWLYENLKVGDQFKVSQPQGDFVLSYQPAGKLLLLSAGSGITPVMSMLRYLTQTGNRSDIVFLHYARSGDDIIFKDELVQFVEKHPGLRLCFSVESEVENSTQHITMEKGRISKTQLTRFVPDLLDREIYLCGPQPFMKATMDILEAKSFNLSKLHFENFTADLSTSLSLGYSTSLSFSVSDKNISATSSKTILEEAESVGLTPKAACRMGICRTCRCKKETGITVNLVTGEESTTEGDYILPCVSVAKTPTTIEL